MNAATTWRRLAGVQGQIRTLIRWIATENPTSGYMRLQGRLRNWAIVSQGSTIGKIFADVGMPPVPQRPETWQFFVKAHWPAVLAAGFFTTKAWTERSDASVVSTFSRTGCR
jgi:hypothetical protein